MHVAIFLDQNPATLGGAQASVMLQKKYLEQLGHRVTVVAPQGDYPPAPGILTYPSIPLTINREFSFTFRIRHSLKVINQKFDQLGVAVDLVHNQADNWGAALATLFAKQHDLPLVFTMHTNLDYALRKFVGAGFAKVLSLALSSGYKFGAKENQSKVTTDLWRYLKTLASAADLVLTPSQHFANLAKAHDVAKDIQVLPNGVDDELAETSFAIKTKPEHLASEPTSLLWCGRISPEKRIMVLLKAMTLAKVNVELKVFGSGNQLEEAQRYVKLHKLGKKVHFMGRLNHQEMLLEMRKADVLVQTSVGFETQGMTVYEAGVMGTPSIICDHNIAADIPQDGCWLVADESAEALAESLKQASLAVESNQSKKIDLRKTMLQSRIVKLQLDYYQRAITLHDNKKAA